MKKKIKVPSESGSRSRARTRRDCHAAMNTNANRERQSRRLLKIAAYHEAGHDVAALYLGGQLDSVLAHLNAGRPDRVCEYTCVPLASLPADGQIVAKRATVDRDVVVALAGPVAEARLRHIRATQVYYDNGSVDLCVSLDALCHLDEADCPPLKNLGQNPSTAQLFPLLPLLEAKARRLMSRPEIWAAVVALASALQAQRVLDADEVNAIVGGITAATIDEGFRRLAGL